jgi:hypothetical protein
LFSDRLDPRQNLAVPIKSVLYPLNYCVKNFGTVGALKGIGALHFRQFVQARTNTNRENIFRHFEFTFASFGICDGYSPTVFRRKSACLCRLVQLLSSNSTINDSGGLQILGLPPQSVVNGAIAAAMSVSIRCPTLLRPLFITALDSRELFSSQPIRYILRIEPNGPANVKSRQCAVRHHFINVLIGNSQEFCYFLNG